MRDGLRELLDHYPASFIALVIVLVVPAFFMLRLCWSPKRNVSHKIPPDEPLPDLTDDQVSTLKFVMEGRGEMRFLELHKALGDRVNIQAALKHMRQHPDEFFLTGEKACRTYKLGNENFYTMTEADDAYFLSEYRVAEEKRNRRAAKKLASKRRIGRRLKSSQEATEKRCEGG